MPEEISEELAGIVDSAAAMFGTEDSEGEEPEEQPEEPDEDAEEADELEDDELNELDVDLEDDDQDLEEDDDPDELDDEDSDEEDSDDEDEEDLEDEEDSDEEDSDDDEEDKDDELYTVKVQGQEFQVPREELVAGYQRQQDYTLKTQQLSDIYQRMSTWYEERANDPEFWVQEIASSQEDPAATIAGAIRRTGDATTILSHTLRHLVESGEVADELVEALNLAHIAEEAKGSAVELKVKKLEQQLQERDQTAQQQAEHARVEQEINRQWAGLGLEFEDPAQEHEAKTAVLQFAYERGIPSIQDAYTLMTSSGGDQAAPAPKTPPKRKQAKSAVKKRKTAAMSRKPTGGSPSGGTAKSRKGAADPVGSAAEEALASLGLPDD